MPWIYLIAAIALEVVGTTALKLSDGFSKFGWGAFSLALYTASLLLLSLVLKTMPVGIAYAVWSGLGIALVALIGTVAFGQRLDGPAWVGMGLIVAGVLVLNLVSKSG